MKRLLLISFLLFSSFLYSQTVNVMSYNIKYDNKHDSVNNWELRKEKMVELIQYYNADFIGLQESLLHQHSYLKQELGHFNLIGVGRDDGKDKGEFSPILFNHNKYKLIKSSTFWLSETPGTPSTGWDAALNRVCTYGLFEDIVSKKKIWIFNTHFDHVGNEARSKSTRLIVKKINELNSHNYPVVLMGDLNLTPEKEPIQFLKSTLKDAKEISKSSFYGPNGTYNGFKNDIINVRIDYIFTKYIEVHSFIHIDDRLNTNNHISDHYPVLANIKF